MLVDVPLRDQLAEPVFDHAPDENARANCVPASLAAAFTALTGRAYYGDELKDAVYGEGYTGATDPARYIAYAAQQGIHMWEVRAATGEALVAAIKAALEYGHPVYGAIPSQWGNTTAADIAARGGPTHAVMFCDADLATDTLTAMNPWPVDGHNAFYQRMPAAWWANRLVYGHVYPLEGILTMAFVKQPDGSVRDDRTGVVLRFGMADYVLTHNVTQHALFAETYYTSHDSFCPCDGGLVLTYNKAENQVRADRAGQTLLAIWNLLGAANAQIAALRADLGKQTSGDAASSEAIRALATALASLPHS